MSHSTIDLLGGQMLAAGTFAKLAGGNTFTGTQTFADITFTSSATNVANFTGLTKAGTSTSSASVLMTSLGVSGASAFGGTLTVQDATFQVKSGSTQAVELKNTSGYGKLSVFNNVGTAQATIDAGDVNIFLLNTRMGSSSDHSGEKLQVTGTSWFSGAATLGGSLTVAGTVIHTLSATPASAAATGTVGTISWDTSFIYICTATNTWKRVAIATW